jgi:hypothetical protein
LIEISLGESPTPDLKALVIIIPVLYKSRTLLHGIDDCNVGIPQHLVSEIATDL